MRSVLKVAVGLVVALVVIVAALMVFGSLRARAARKAWAETFGSREAFAQRYPDRRANEAARELERLAARLGIRLAPREPGRALPSETEEKAFEAFTNRELAPFLALLDRRDDRVEAPPAEVVAFRTRHAAEIEAVVAHVLTSEAIQWDRVVRVDGPLPGLIGLRQLTSVLLGEALERNRAGDQGGALRALEACWKVNTDLHTAPLVFSQLMVIAFDSMQFGALRRMGPLPAVWSARVREHDYREAMLIALQGETISFLEYGRRDVREGSQARKHGESRWDWLFRVVYMELSLGGYSDAMRQTILRLRDADPCELDPTAFDKEVEASIPWWNSIAKLAIPSLARTWVAATNAALEAELTANVLRARSIGTETGAWPGPPVASGVCRDTRWSHEALPDGGLRIALDRAFPASERFPKAFELLGESKGAPGS